MLDTTIRVFLINLERSPDRLIHATNTFKQVGLPFERIAAVDGTKLDMEHIETFADREAVEKDKWLTSSAIGCSLSHYKAYKQFLESDADWALFVEDDVEFSPNVVDVLNNAIRTINKTDVFLLYFHGRDKSYSKHSKIEVDSKHAFFAATNLLDVYSAGAYLIHRDVAQRLHDYVFPVHTTADRHGDFHRAGIIGGLWALLPPITRTSYFGSDISYSMLGSLLRKAEAVKCLAISRPLRWLRKTAGSTKTRYHLVDETPTWLSDRRSLK
jgi:GR25 family glycosyltransferase involved in LPS biosynthesis